MKLRYNFLTIAITIIFISCESKKTNVLFLGDSITHGVPHNYRYSLWKSMIDAGWNVDLIGTVEDWNSYPDYKGYSFDTDHEGHSGWTSGQINSSLKNWLCYYSPDLVLYHIGTNDMWFYSVDSSMVAISQTIEQLRAKNPNVKIYLSQIIPIGENNEWVEGIDGYNWLIEFNDRIENLASELNTGESPITIADHNTVFESEDLVADKVHPSEQGAEKMAKTWVNALRLN